MWSARRIVLPLFRAFFFLTIISPFPFLLLLAWECCPGRIHEAWLSAQHLPGALVWTGNPRQSPATHVQINSIAHASWAWSGLSLIEALCMCCEQESLMGSVTHEAHCMLSNCVQHMWSRSSFSPGSCPEQCMWIENCKQKYNVSSHVYFL